MGLLLYSVGAAVYAADRLTKVLAEAHLESRAPIQVIPGVVELRFTENPGGAFGLFGGATWLFVGASVLVVAAILFASRSVPTRSTAMALGLVLGGAVGNLTDRVIRGPRFSGKVVDFVDLQIWPVFNVADSCIVIGALMLVFIGFRGRHHDAEAA